MAPTTRQSRVWALVRRQHGVVTRAQLLALGYSSEAIRHRIRDARLHPVRRGVYAVGRPELTQLGEWMAAVLAAGPGAVLSHGTAAALWGLMPAPRSLHVSVPSGNSRKPSGVVVHRRTDLRDVATRHGIPVTGVVCTLIDVAACVGRRELERAVNQADALGLVDPEELRRLLDDTPPRRGVGRLREMLDRHSLRFTRSELERRFLRLAREAGLPLPDTNTSVNGFEVDFYWPDLSLVVETDGLRYHRTPAQQARDRRRDQAHTASGLTQLRFTHEQVRYEADEVRTTLAATVRRLA